MREGSVRAIDESVRDLLARHQRLVLAVSGGVDSAVLLDAVARLRTPADRVVVASVDHGTGPAAAEATARVVATAARHGLPAITELLNVERPGEAAWREGRWAFLRRVAATERAPVVTAHNRDDQVETVVMRLLRGAGARGLAGLFAASPIERPLLDQGRDDILRYAAIRRVEFVEDPSNSSRAFLRNRIRLDLLPAIRAASPEFESRMLAISRQAAEIRMRLDQVAEQFLVESSKQTGAILTFDAGRLEALPSDALKVLLPALVGRSGIRLDRRGIDRLADVIRSAPGSSGQVSGGYEAIRSRDSVAIRRRSRGRRGDGVGTDRERSQLRPRLVHLRASGETRFDGFRFQADPATTFRAERADNESRDPWRIWIPQSVQVVVRQWTPGDRLTIDLKGGRRRVKRFFADAGIVGPLRTGWPVVLCGEDVVWIPGVQASQGAIRHDGRMVQYRCERIRG